MQAESGDGGAEMSAQEQEKVTQQYTKMLKEYKKRRRLCKEALDMIAEGRETTPNQLITEWGPSRDSSSSLAALLAAHCSRLAVPHTVSHVVTGLETDEDYGFDINRYPTLTTHSAAIGGIKFGATSGRGRGRGRA